MVTDEEVNEAWEALCREHIEPSRLFIIAQKIRPPTDDEAKHLAECERCKGWLDGMANGRVVLNGQVAVRLPDSLPSTTPPSKTDQQRFEAAMVIARKRAASINSEPESQFAAAILQVCDILAETMKQRRASNGKRRNRGHSRRSR